MPADGPVPEQWQRLDTGRRTVREVDDEPVPPVHPLVRQLADDRGSWRARGVDVCLWFVPEGSDHLSIGVRGDLGRATELLRAHYGSCTEVEAADIRPAAGG